MSKAVNYVDVKCPSCGQTVISHPDTDYHYGSPFRQCPHCGTECMDPYVHEVTVDGIRTEPKLVRQLIRDEIVILVISAVLIALNIVSVALNNVSFLMIFLTVAMLLASVFKVVGFFLAKKSQRQGLAREFEASKARMADPAYAAKLAAGRQKLKG